MLISEGIDRNGGRVHVEVSIEATPDLMFEVLGLSYLLRIYCGYSAVATRSSFAVFQESFL